MKLGSMRLTMPSLASFLLNLNGVTDEDYWNVFASHQSVGRILSAFIGQAFPTVMYHLHHEVSCRDAAISLAGS